MPHGERRMWIAPVRNALAAVIVVAVGLNFHALLRGIDFGSLALRIDLLVPAAVSYLLAHLCWSTFWVRLLHHQGVRVSWYVGLRAYYVSQFGKYIPGKVFVVLMRVAMLRPFGAHPIPVAVTATYETLTSMATGALIGAIFLPALGVLPAWFSGGSWLLVAFAALPVGLGMVNALAVRIANKRRGPDARPLQAPSIFLLAQGLIHGACGYALLALSLGLTTRAVLPTPLAWTAESYAVGLAAAGLSYVAGFVVLVAPGGLGAREQVLQWALTPELEPAFGPEAAGLAVVVALALRLTWTIAEVVLALALYANRPAPPAHE
jgi:hypothetical protein